MEKFIPTVMRIFTVSILLICGILKTADRHYCPEASLDYLQSIEEGRPILPESHLFKYWPLTHSDKAKRYVGEALYAFNSFMHQRYIESYFPYIYALATSQRLTDEEKLDDSLVMIPYFSCMKWVSQDYKNNQLITIMNLGWNDYLLPLKRLFLSALCSAGADLNIGSNSNRPLGIALLYDDQPLIEKLLSHGADPNQKQLLGCFPLEASKSLRASQLLLKYGANIQMQHRHENLIEHLCCRTGIHYDPAMLQLYLESINPSEENDYGKMWFATLARTANEHVNPDNLRQRISILLANNCTYDEEEIEEIMDDKTCINKNEIMTIFFDAFDEDERESLHEDFDQLELS